eukprot:tig00000073_g1719.t1
MERTSEFIAIAESLQSRSGAASHPKPAPKLHKSQFTEIASQISKDIQMTTMKLQKLTKLAQKKSLFDDPAQEIHELTFSIKQDITGLNNQIAKLQQHIHDRHANLPNKQSEAHSQTILDSLKANLNATTKDFKDVVQLRTENLKQQQLRKQQFTFNSPMPKGNEPTVRKAGGGLQPALQSGLSTAAPLLDSEGLAPLAGPSSLGGEERAGGLADMPRPGLRFRNARGAPAGFSSPSGRNDLVLDFGGQGGSGGAGPSGFGGALASQQLQSKYYDSRASAVESVESTIVELSTIFQQLATMVSEQGELVERIDSNVDDLANNVEQGQNQLAKYLKNISSNRWLILKVFFVLLIFICVFVIFVA